ncbi:MAG: 30S ribosomal protein S21 [Candidatus Marinimicrobia bacterium]|jgi:small subunit ribosomal protein S21|nr:30S ribosomal protein S21 [Candidatus Neomarinimicrobiota bacterium]OQC44447.1 MAG: 30S ribosomal protein S21 [Candidatus Marinimicrobia bacterium ADurb.Bin030]NLA22075.1 30S ribosomal protein S21 [Candidatus Neomarinimicrobiota bacterium]HNZ37182.1 30S ribosomal protein S21 [Candidatus Neomarinimicrobiota bacterium]HOD37681.1 30S ribosomal protein S21 [Candidatus Neomarinimicrobiota bacterium]
MVEVTVYDNEPLERALRRFKKKFEKAGILNDVKKRTYYEKPSVEKRMRRAKAIKRLHRTNAQKTAIM